MSTTEIPDPRQSPRCPGANHRAMRNDPNPAAPHKPNLGVLCALGALAVSFVPLLFAGCGVGELDGYAPLTVFDNFRTIAEGQAYRSAQLDADSLALVFDTYGIRTVINLRGENAGVPWYDNERAAAARAGVRHVDVRMSASALPPRAELLKLYDAFENADYPILIHCKSGADRTGAASAIWRMQVAGDSRAAALMELSPLYGHFEARHPEMDELARMFQPTREWIENEYPVD